jgi:hypothetical protein
MDGSRFDDLARLLAKKQNRRSSLRVMTASALGVAGLGWFSADAKDDKKDKKDKKHGDVTTNDGSGDDHDNRGDCARDGKKCQKGRDCCSGHCCNGTCQTCCADADCPTPNDLCKKAACAGGRCTAVVAVVCTAGDRCHLTGTCDPTTGQCTNPPAPAGTACDDGNMCTRNDFCDGAGGCAGTSITCKPLDQCHVAGTCDPATGTCSNPGAPNGTACDDGNACTQTDTCQNGVCVGGNPVVCAAQDTCHDVGVCDTTTGQCSNPPKADGASCNDGNLCTQTDTCQGGVCTGTDPVVCAPPDQCHETGTCDEASGTCVYQAKPDGAPCTGTNLCFNTYSCQAGACVGTDPVVCTARDQCHLAGVCKPATGLCSDPEAEDATSCAPTEPADPCSTGYACSNGTCLSKGSLHCDDSALGPCQECGGPGGCHVVDQPDGTTCPAGLNQTGTCTTGECRILCNPDYADCDGQTGTGCETAIRIDPRNCGACGHVCAAGETCVSGTCTGGSGSDAICRAAIDGCSIGATLCDDGLGETCNCFTTTEGATRCASLHVFPSCDNGCTNSAACPGTPYPDGSGTFSSGAFCARVDGCCDAGAGVAVCLEPCPSYCTITCSDQQTCLGNTCIGPGRVETGTLTAGGPVFARCGGFGTGYLYQASTYDHQGGNLAINLRGAASGGGTIDDTYLYLYTRFDPANPCDGVLAEGDDIACSFESRIVGTFAAGTYTVVATTYQPNVVGEFTLEFNRRNPCGE